MEAQPSQVLSAPTLTVAAPPAAAPPVALAAPTPVNNRAPSKHGAVPILFTVLLLGIVVAMIVWQVNRMEERLTRLEQTTQVCRSKEVWKAEADVEDEEEDEDEEELALERNEDEVVTPTIFEEDEEAPPQASV